MMSTPVAKPIRKIGGAVGNATRWTSDKARAVGNKAGNVKQRIQNNDKFRYLADSREGQYIKGAGRAMKYTAKQAGRSLVKKGIPRMANIAVKGAVGAAVGATAGMLGATAAIASGDPSNLLTYGAGAAAAGATLGSSRVNVNPQPRTRSAAQIAREKAFYGDRYDEHVAERNLKEWKRNVAKREELEKYLSADEVKKLYKGENPIIDTYLKNEITDTKDIATIEKMLKDETIKSREEGIALQMNVDKKGDLTNMKPKDKEDWRKDDAETYKKKFGISEERAKKMAEDQQAKEISYLDIRKKLK